MTSAGSAPTRPSYRPDIDGLRAIAVAIVVAYHAFPRFAPGGFVGVDVFFVISGFLITTLLLREHERGEFSILEFLARRARRILPALIVVLVVVLGASSLAMFPGEFRLVGTDTMAGSAFVSNLAAFKTSQEYFAPSAEVTPLLHLWSLGIEEQFYLVWPWALMLLWRRRVAAVVLGIAIVASFVAATVRVRVDPIGAFYLPQFRAWELLAGALLAFAAMRDGELRTSRARIAGIGGIALIAIATVALSREQPYPSWRAFLPVVGTLLLIASGEASAVNRALSHRWIVYIGLISYPLYLWHWPALAFTRLVAARPSTWMIACAVAVSAVLAVVTYHAIEQPMRRRSSTRVALPLLGALAVVGIVGLGVRQGRIPARSASIVLLESWGYPGLGTMRHTASGLRIVSAGAQRPARGVLFIGDSHMEQYWPRVDSLTHRLEAERIKVTFATISGCPTLPGLERVARARQCVAFYDGAMQMARDSAFDTVVIGGFWEGYFLAPFGEGGWAGFDRAVFRLDDRVRTSLRLDSPAGGKVLNEFRSELERLSKQGTHIVLLLSNPTDYAFDPARMVRRLTWERIETPPVSAAAYRAYLAPVATPLRQAFESVGGRVIDPISFLCEGDRCPTRRLDGVPTYNDPNHVRPSTAARLTLVDSAIWGGTGSSGR
jgi:peptidoglycan/LPS O-acetylase OafA/YrhL